MSTEITAPVVLPEVTMTPELAKAIQDAVSGPEVRALILAAAEKQLDTSTQLAADQAAAEKAAADKIVTDKAAADAAAAAQGVSRVVEIGGKSFTFEGASEAEVDRLELNALKIAYAVREPEAAHAVVDPAIAAAEAQKAAEAEVLAKVELERKFKLGEISASEYIQQSGALKSYLESEGISLEALREKTEESRDNKFEQSWAQAGAAFQHSPAGLDWPGGTKNQELLGLKIAALGLTDAPDKVAALAQAYAELKRTGLYFPNGDGDVVVPAPKAADAAVAAAQAAADAAAKAAADPTVIAAAAARAAAAAKVQSMSSSIFGASSGTSGAPVLSPAVVDAKKIVPADASPAEIMQAWKDAQIANGINPNDAFLSSHRAKAM